MEPNKEGPNSKRKIDLGQELRDAGCFLHVGGDVGFGALGLYTHCERLGCGGSHGCFGHHGIERDHENYNVQNFPKSTISG